MSDPGGYPGPVRPCWRTRITGSRSSVGVAWSTRSFEGRLAGLKSAAVGRIRGLQRLLVFFYASAFGKTSAKGVVGLMAMVFLLPDMSLRIG